MDSVANLPVDDRAEIFRETGARMGLPGALVEKDFWVCWTLGHLFKLESLRDVLMFKGGTSLSKIFHVIERFSEDIDLAIDYAPLGFIGDRDPVSDMSRSRRDKLLGEMMTACRTYIAGPFLDAFRDRCEATILHGSWDVAVSDDDANAVEFTYPSSGLRRIEYVKPRVLLELGTHAELIPSDEYSIKPFAAEQFPGVFHHPSCRVKAIKAERTFWEKATILHAEHHRPSEKPMPEAHSRHYYDVYMLARTGICDAAIGDGDLLHRVVRHKTKFYYSAWARYDLAVPGTMALVPPEARNTELRRDYRAMENMIFGDPPPLEEILNGLARLEARIRSTSVQRSG